MKQDRCLCQAVRLFAWVAAALIGLSSSTIAAQPGRPAVFSQTDREAALQRDMPFFEPPEIGPGSKETSVCLRVVEATNYLDEFQLRHRSYNGGLVGPTIRVRPGQNLRVRLVNELEPEPDDAFHNINDPHGYNTTNLHTHGLHVSPEDPADNVFREVRPGKEWQYEFPIEPDHPAGTFWYHAHKHGSTALQLASGMAGVLIVEGGLDDIPEIRAMDEKIIVLQQFSFVSCNEGPGVVTKLAVYDQTVLPIAAINGVRTPTIVMRPGEIQRWRIIHAGTAEAIELDLEGMPFFELARDGLATGRREELPRINLYPGSRVDVLVQAPGAPASRLLYSAIPDPADSIQGLVVARENLLKIEVAGAPVTMAWPPDESLKAVAAFTNDDVPDDGIPTREIRFDDRNDRFLVDGKPFDPATISHSLLLGTAEEWKLTSLGGAHPFHIHVNPFAVKPATDTGEWSWQDTVLVKKNAPVTIRMRFLKHTGRTVLHCHNLLHEDQGMMQAIVIEDPTVPTGAEAASAVPAVPSWTAKDRAGSPVSASDFPAQAHLLVFHRGLRCLHCAGQLTKLAEQAEKWEQAGIRLVAVCPELPESPELVQAIDAFPFPFLVDPELAAFRDFKCLDADGQPQHGLFLVNRENRLVLRHVSEIAVADPFAFLSERVPFFPRSE